MAEPQIQITTPANRASAQDQILEVLERAKLKQDVFRIRIPFTLYEYGVSRNYATVRDAVWNIAIPTDQVSVEYVETLIQTIGVCIAAIAKEGADVVVAKLGVEP
jgi:hypothetical protein